MRKPTLILAGLFCTLFLGGCATSLPDISTLPQLEPSAAPRILGTKGRLRQQQAQRVLVREEQGAHAEDLIRETVSRVDSLGGRTLTAGNRVDLLVDGAATYDAMFKAMEEAKNHINFETFIFSDDDVGLRFAELFVRKQSEGVQVNVIYDAVGSLRTPAAFFERLRAAGVNVLQFNPINPLKIRKKLLITRRDHRKVAVIDGKVAFTGGINVSNVYYGSSSSLSGQRQEAKEGWRDTHIRIEGPAVADLQRSFMDTWHYQNGPALTGKNYFPPPKAAGTALVQVVPSYQGEKHRLTYIMYIAAIKNAKYSIDLTTPYFVPDHEMRKAIAEAARRGVDIRLILPSASDSAMTLAAGRSFYSDLLESGVSVYELQDRILHAKTVVVDGVWSTVGSTNMDLWSFARNNEMNVIIIGKDFASKMEAVFDEDLTKCNQIIGEEWAHRPILNRLTEFFSRLFAHWL